MYLVWDFFIHNDNADRYKPVMLHKKLFMKTTVTLLEVLVLCRPAEQPLPRLPQLAAGNVLQGIQPIELPSQHLTAEKGHQMRTKQMHNAMYMHPIQQPDPAKSIGFISTSKSLSVRKIYLL